MDATTLATGSIEVAIVVAVIGFGKGCYQLSQHLIKNGCRSSCFWGNLEVDGDDDPPRSTPSSPARELPVSILVRNSANDHQPLAMV